MGQEPGAIREEIEQTRAEMGDTVEALGYKADVKGRAKDRLSGTVDSARSRVTGATSKVSSSMPDSGQVKQQAKGLASTAQENPLGLAIGAAAVGFVAGMLIPSTRVEDERIGQVADDVKDRVKETGQEAVERGKEVAQQAAQSAKETAQEQGQEHAQELATSAFEKTEETQRQTDDGVGSAA